MWWLQLWFVLLALPPVWTAQLWAQLRWGTTTTTTTSNNNNKTPTVDLPLPNNFPNSYSLKSLNSSMWWYITTLFTVQDHEKIHVAMFKLSEMNTRFWYWFSVWLLKVMEMLNIVRIIFISKISLLSMKSSLLLNTPKMQMEIFSLISRKI